MAEPFNPASALLKDRKNWLWVPAIALIDQPKVGEATAASAIDMSLALFPSSTTPTRETGSEAGNRRWGSSITPQRLGDTILNGGEIRFPMNPQAAAGSPEKKLWETFKDPVSGFFLDRLNVPRAQPLVAGQWVSVYAVNVDGAFQAPEGDNSAAEAGAMARYACSDFRQVVQLVTGT